MNETVTRERVRFDKKEKKKKNDYHLLAVHIQTRRDLLLIFVKLKSKCTGCNWDKKR